MSSVRSMRIFEQMQRCPNQARKNPEQPPTWKHMHMFLNGCQFQLHQEPPLVYCCCCCGGVVGGGGGGGGGEWLFW